jgi:hypothetical protein
VADLGEGDMLFLVPIDAEGVRLDGSGVEWLGPAAIGLSDAGCSIFIGVSILY